MQFRIRIRRTPFGPKVNRSNAGSSRTGAIQAVPVSNHDLALKANGQIPGAMGPHTYGK
jgi:hypothetical protein